MTTLAITPNWKNKTAKFKGTVAAGEHVSVTIQNDDGEGGEFIADASTLRLRVVNPCNGRTLAIFPEPVPEGETPETWDSDLSPLHCTLNLNTVQMLKAVPPAANVPLLFVLDDYDNNTLYFKEQFEVAHWPRRFGEEEPAPTNLDDYKDIIEDFNTRLTAAEQTVATAATNAQNAAISASAAASSAATAATAATDAQTGAIASKNAAQTAANDAATAKTAAVDAQDAAEDAQEAAETARGKAQEYAEAAAESAAAFVVDDTLSVEGAAADAKAVGDANQDLITQIETVRDNLDDETTARETLDGAVQVDRQNLANEIARAQGAEQTLEANKADKATTYTKTEVDAKVAGVQTFKKYLVQTLPDPDEADMKGLYLVPTGETREEGDLCEEWTVVEDSGEKRWEKIGGTTVDLSDYYDKDAVDDLLDDKQDALTFDNAPISGSNNPVKSGGIWSALWGALTALPTGFTSLYDWCVSQLAGKQPRLTPAGATVLGGIKTVWAEVKRQGSTVLLRLPTELITINGKALSSDVTLTGADIPVDATQGAQKIDAALAGKADSSSIAAVFDASKQGGYAVGDVVMYNGARYCCTTAHTGAWDAGHFETQTVEAAKANDNAVVKLTGDQTIGGNKTFTGNDYFYDFTVAHPQGMGYIRIYALANENRVRIDFSDAVSGSHGELFLPVLGGYGAVTLAAIENLAPDFMPLASEGYVFAENTLCCYQGVLYRCILGYTFASGDDYPPNDSTHWATATVENVLAALRTALAGKADASAIPYSLVTKTISNGAVSLDDRASNSVTVSATLSPNTLTINFPTATSGKVRDFALRLNIAAGVTAPEIAWPQGVTLENDGGEVPEIADGGTGGSSTILYFSETENNGTTAKFLVKGEALTAITQA